MAGLGQRGGKVREKLGKFPRGCGGVRKRGGRGATERGVSGWGGSRSGLYTRRGERRRCDEI